MEIGRWSLDFEATRAPSGSCHGCSDSSGTRGTELGSWVWKSGKVWYVWNLPVSSVSSVSAVTLNRRASLAAEFQIPFSKFLDFVRSHAEHMYWIIYEVEVFLRNLELGNLDVTLHFRTLLSIWGQLQGTAPWDPLHPTGKKPSKDQLGLKWAFLAKISQCSPVRAPISHRTTFPDS